jgi:hypothetical protein
VRLVLGLALVAASVALGAGTADAAPAQCTTSSCAVLTITIEGHGTVTSSLGGCTSTGASALCTQAFEIGAAATLTAVPLPGWLFTGWGGACSGKGSCSVTMSQARSVTATFASAPPPPALALKSLGKPVVRAGGTGFLVTIRFSTTRAGTGRLHLVRSGQQTGTITFTVRAGRRQFGPFVVRGRGPYVLGLAFTDLSGRTKSLSWRTCLGTCVRVQPPPPAPPPPPPPPPTSTATPPPPPPPTSTTSGPLKLTREAADVAKRAGGASVTLHFTSSESITVLVDVLRNSNVVLKGLKFSFAAGGAKIGPFAINRAGSYSFRLVATDAKGRSASLRWDVKV